MVRFTCHAEFCDNKQGQIQRGKTKISYFLCPDDQTIRQQWIRAIDRPDGWRLPKHLFLCSAHFSPDVMTGPHARGSLRLKKGALPTLFRRLQDFPIEEQDEIIQRRLHFVKVEDAMLAQSEKEDPLGTTGNEGTSPKIQLPTIDLDSDSDAEHEDISSAGSQLPEKPIRAYGAVKIVCEICDALFKSSAKYRRHRIEHEKQAITPSPAARTSNSENTRVPAQPGLEEIMDSVIEDIGAKNAASNNLDEAASNFEKADDSHQNLVCLGRNESEPEAAAAPSTDSDGVCLETTEKKSAASAAVKASAKSAVVKPPALAGGIKTPTAPSSYKSTQGIVCYPPHKQLAVASALKEVSIHNPQRTKPVLWDDPAANFRCEICKREFYDSVSFDTHKRVHQLQDQIKNPGSSKRLEANTKSPKIPQLQCQMVPENSLKKLEFDAKSQAKESEKAEKIIKVVYKKMRSLLEENKFLKALLKKHRIDLNSWKGNVELIAGLEVTPGLKHLDDIILNAEGGSFLGRLNLPQIEKLCNVGVLVLEKDGTLRERIIGGSLAGSPAPKEEKTVGVNQIERSPTEASIPADCGDAQITGNVSDFKVEYSTLMDTDDLFEIEIPSVTDNSPQKIEKEHGVETGKSFQEAATDPLEEIGSSLADITDSINALDAPKHACGLCGHRTATQEDMLVHLTTHIDVENNEVDEVSNLQDAVILTGDSTTLAESESYSTTNCNSTNMAQASTHSSNVESPECNDQCPEKCAPKPKRPRPKKYSCNLCDYRCRVPSELFEHKKSRHGMETESTEYAKNLVCGVCDYRTENAGNMKRHMATHTGIKPFACDKCDVKYASKWALGVHARIHSDVPLPKSHKCDRCSFAAVDGIQLRAHMRRVHKLVTPRPGAIRNIQCESCDKTFTHRGTYRMHRKSHEANSAYRLHKLYTCDICFKSVGGMGALGKHKSSCVREFERVTQEKYACRSCGEHFSTQEEGLAHNCPTPTKFRCHICEFSSKLRAHLDMHMMIHTGEKPHECKVCHTRFRQRPHLIVHMRTHTGEKPYACRHCGKAFAAKQNMVAHEKIHSGECPYECTFCDYRTKERRYLRKHMHTHHYVEENDLVMENM